jgi:hypothetical protein
MAGKYKITIAPRAETKRFDEIELTVEQLKTLLAIHNPRKDKDGKLFLPGRLVGGKRAATSVPEINCLVYDIDGTNSVAEIDAILSTAGVFAILYSTYNHGRTKTTVKTDMYDKWAKRAGAKLIPDLESMGEYLKYAKKGHLTGIKFDGTTEHTGNGIVYLLEHDPEDKVRVVFPLGDKPIVLSKLSKLTAVAVDTYKSIYHGVGEALGMRYDEACSDPSRLHYLPGHPIGSTIHFVRMYDGPFMDYTDYPRSNRVGLDRKVVNPDGTTQLKKPTDLVVYDKNQRRIDLRSWHKKNRLDFDMEGLLLSVLPPENLRGPRAGGKEGHHIACPFEHEHTDSGGMGTFVAPPEPDEDKPWTIYCSHQSCQTAGRKGPEFLKQLIEDGYVTADDLGIEAPKQEEIAQDMGIDPDTLPANFDAFNEHLTALSSAEDLTEAMQRLEEALKDARYANRIIEFVQAALDKGLKMPVEAMANLVANTQADIKSVETFARKMPHAVENTGVAEFSKMVRHIRESNESIVKAIGDVLTEQVVGREQHDKLKQIAAWYGISYNDAEKEYRVQSLSQAKDEHDELMLRHFAIMNKQWAKVHSGTSTMFLDMIASRKTGVPKLHSKDSLNLTYSNALINIYKNDKKGNQKTATENVFNVWNTRCRDIKLFRGLTFDPSLPGETEEGLFNLWSGLHMQAVPGDASPILDHLKHIWCGGVEEHFNWLQLYIWDIFMNPGLKPHSNVMILGGQGTGKSIVFEHGLRHMLDPYYVQTSNRADLQGQFNAIAENKLLFYADEALFSGDRAGAAMLKGKVSQETLRIERKGVDTYLVPHFTRYFFTSNEEHAMHLDSDDRRYFVVRTSDKHKQNPEYFEKLRHWLTNEQGCNKWLHHIKNWKPEQYGLKRHDLFVPPSTDAKEGQISQSIDPAAEFFLEIIKVGRLVSLGDAVPLPVTFSWALDQEFPIRSESLKAMFDLYLRHLAGAAHRFERPKYAELFKKFFGDSPSGISKAVRIHGRPTKVVVLPPRADVLKYLNGLKIINDKDYQECLENTDSHIPPYNLDDMG